MIPLDKKKMNPETAMYPIRPYLQFSFNVPFIRFYMRMSRRDWMSTYILDGKQNGEREAGQSASRRVNDYLQGKRGDGTDDRGFLTYFPCYVQRLESVPTVRGLEVVTKEG
jgi:hypothetical protein